MAACRSCGRENPEDARFCNACGALLTTEPAPAREVRKIVTVVFADVTGSTALGERLDPESMRRVMARWHDAMRNVLERHGGTVEKFIGDAVMAVFGIPTLHEDDALRAVRAAAEMRDALAALNKELERDYSVRIESRTGVNTGEVVAGVGETLATGDAVNVAARLEQAAEPGEALVGEETVRLVRGAVQVEPVELPPLKGKTAPVRAYRLLEVGGTVARPLDAAMVGRDRELAQLLRAYDHATSERTAYLFTLLGPAGIGKSRLVQELVDTVWGDATVLRGRCLPYGDGITYWPLAEMLQEAAHHEVRARLVEQLRGERDAELIATRLAAAIGAADGAGSTEETFWAVRRLFERLARERPLVVVFEDLHWAEPTLLDLVDHLAEWSREAPVLLVCLARPELLETRPGWGGGKLNATSLLLEPLSDTESQQLIDRLLTSALPMATRARIAEAAEGNPLFVEQMLAMVAEAGTGGEVQVPPTIHALLAARLDRLGPGERDVIERAAIEGKHFHRGAIVELAPIELREHISRHFASLVRKELIRPDEPAVADEDAFRFRHQLIRDAAYDGMPKELRAELHERFADWLGRVAADRVAEVEEILGYHLEQAYLYRAELGPVGETERNLARRAAERLITSGRRALARADLPAATGLLERAGRLLPADDLEWLAVLPELAELHVDAGAFARADELITASLAASDAAVRARGLLARVVRDAQTGGRMDEMLVDAEHAARELERLGDDPGLAKAVNVRARMHFYRGQAAEAEAGYARAAELARRSGALSVELEALDWALGVKLYGPTSVAEGIAYADELIARRTGNAHLDAFALCVRGALTATLGRFDEAREFVGRGQALADELGLVLRQGVDSLQEAAVEMLAGDLAAAERALREGSEILAGVGETGFRSTVDGLLAEVFVRSGRDDEAERLARAVLSYATEDDVEPQARARTVVALVLAHRGEHAEAEGLARKAVELTAPTDYLESKADAAFGLAEVLKLAGRAAEAAEASVSALRFYEEKGNIVMANRVQSFLAELAVPSP